MKVVLGLSGGVDSATLAAYYLDAGYEVIPVNFLYGSKHNQWEAQAAEMLRDYYSLPPIITIPLSFMKGFKSNLLKNGGPIPKGHYQDKNMTLTVVPGRNMIFLSIMLGYAWSLGADIIAYGAHSGDHAIYEDCRPQFVHALSLAVTFGSGGRVTLEAPFLFMSKTDIVRTGVILKVPYEMTRTCYQDTPLACGKCGSCVERLEAFKTLGIEDPIKYS